MWPRQGDQRQLLGFNAVPKTSREWPLIKEWNSQQYNSNETFEVYEHVSCLISFVIKQEITICQEIPVFPAPWGGKSRAISQYTGRRAGQYQDAYLTNIDAEGQRAERGTFFPIHCPALCQLPKLLSLLHPFPTNFSFFLEFKGKNVSSHNQKAELVSHKSVFSQHDWN